MRGFVALRAEPLALPLLVARVAADDANDALALDDLALGADGFDAGSNFHGFGLGEAQVKTTVDRGMTTGG